MSLSKISEFANFLAGRDRTLKEILNHLGRTVLESYDVDSIVFFQANDAGQIYPIDTSGVNIESVKEIAPNYSLEEKWPVSDAIRHGVPVWINKFNNSLITYPKLSEYPLLVGSKSLIFFPVFMLGTPVAVIAINSRVHLEEEDSFNVFLTAVASVFSMYFYRNLNSSEIVDAHEVARKKLLPTIGFEESLSLTDRQLVILRLISEDRTNKGISEFLGYSESTVRQDIMKIFAQLGCTHRSEASTLYREYSSKHQV